MKALSARFSVCRQSRSRLWLVCCAGVTLALGSPELFADSVGQNVLDQIASLQTEKSTRTAAQLKLDSQIHYALKLSRNEQIAPGVAPTLQPFLPRQADGRVQVDISATVSPDLLNYIMQSGGTVINSVPRFNAVRAIIPLAFAEQLAARADVTSIRPASPMQLDTGSVDSEGDTTHRAIEARPAFGVDGTGVKVGVLSDSVDYMAAAQATGDLPPNVTVLPGQSGVPGSGEGTAMLEIVADLAPGATLYFATAGGGEAGFAQNILDLRAAGCDIIVDDVRYPTEPVFQDGPVARAVNAVTRDGAWYFASAGNSGNKAHNTSGTWEGDFVDGGPAGNPVNSKPGNLAMFGANTYNTITQGGSAAILYWADPLGASTNDYDMYLTDGSGTILLGASTNPQNGSQDPIEGFLGYFTNGIRIVVVKASGDARFLHIDSGRGRLEENTAGFARGHSAATNAFSTAAIDVATSFPGPFVGGAQNPVEDFSSDGPRRMFFQEDGTPITPGNFLSTGGAVRQYPTVAAADGVSTTLPSDSGLNPFFGTSAAAPHAAAIAALVKSYNPLLTPAQGRQILTTTTLDNEAPGLDDTGGYGILSAMNALAATPPPNVPVLQIRTNYVVGGNGNGVVDIDECNDLYIVLTNVGMLAATNVEVTITTTNTGVFIPQPTAFYPNIPTNTAATNLSPFKIGTSPKFICGTRINLQVAMKSDTGVKVNLLPLDTGTNAPPATFTSFFPANIPDNNFLGTNSAIYVPNVAGVIQKVTVSLYTVHPSVGDLTFRLISPDGTNVLLTANHGGTGANYGLACFPTTSRTLFDDDATNLIANGRAPFVGSFKPDQALSAFAGKSGTNAVGIWQLVAIDSGAGNVGTLECWSLNISSSSCAPGGGQCPGVDLSLSMQDAPDPAVISSNLTYTISVTNNGPNTARGVVVTHNLPGSMQFVSALASQGGASYAGGVVTATLGNLGIDEVATVTVVVRPTLSGTFFSSASVASTDPELNPLNNSVTVGTVIVPPLSDLAVGIADFPDPTVVGGQYTYTIAVTNLGPASASGVVVSNVLPATVRINSLTSSQGSIVSAGNVVLFTAGYLPKDAFATATIVVTPQAYGVLSAVATVSAIQPDPYLANNTAVATTTVGQASDLGISMTALPNPVVLNSNITYQITVTNLGPNTATNVVVSQSLPTGISVSTVSLSQGSYSLSGSSLLCNVGTIIVGGSANIRVVAATTRIGTLTSSATVTSSQTDPNSDNNAANASAQVAPPFISIVPAGATLVSENFYPADGSIEAGETVTIQFRLQNVGNVANTNLLATLLPTGGVTSPSAAQTYGILRPVGVPGGAPVTRQFTFTAAAGAGDYITATFQLQDSGSSLPPAIFSFGLPRVVSFANPGYIAVPQFGALDQVGPANPYPSTIDVSGVTGQVGKVTVTLSNLSHGYAHDLNALLVSPTGTNVLLLSHAADISAATNVTLTFDGTAESSLPDLGQLMTGTWLPTAYPPEVVFSNPAPAGPYSTLLSDLNGLNPNGKWLLYLLDDHTGDTGSIAGGWSISLTSVTPVNQLADVGIRAYASPEPVLVDDFLTYTFIVSNAGPATATGVNFSNTFPPFVTFVGANISQGNWTTNGNVLLGNFATLPAGASAALTAVVRPQVGSPNLITNTGYVSAFESDIHTGDNRATVVSTVKLPSTGLTAGMMASPDPVIVGSNLTYTISITNGGPGKALNVTVTDRIPGASQFVTASASQGTVSEAAGVLTASLGTLAPGGLAAVTLVVAPSTAGPLTNSADITTASSETLTSQSVGATVQVNNPSAKLVPAGATLLSESFSPPNGTIQPGETVTLSLALVNQGVLDTANLTATLLESGGVISPSAAASYGVVSHNGTAVARAFSFTAGNPPDGVIAATLQLQDGATDLGTVTYNFALPATLSFASTNAVIIPDHGMATPYPSTLTLSGLSGVVGKVTVNVHGLSHGFPADVNILLVGPANSQVLLMSHCGGGFNIENVELTFDDAAANVLPGNAVIASGNYKPSRYGSGVVFPIPAPLSPYGATLAGFNGINPNGTWALYVLDDSIGDAGAIASGWDLKVTTIEPLVAPPRLVAAFSQNLLHLVLYGVPGNTYVIEGSADLNSWTPLYSGTAANDGTVSYTDPESGTLGTRFYRAQRQGP